MPVSPDLGSKFAAPVADLMTQQELDLLETAALALRGDQDRSDWEQQALARIKAWRIAADRGTAGALGELGKAVRTALLGAQAEGAAGALVDLPGEPSAPPLDKRGLMLSEKRLGKQLAAALQQTPRLLEATLREAVRAGVDEVRAGESTRRTDSQRVLDKLMRQGITGFRDKAGRNWSLSAYAEMAARTETQARALAAGDATIRAAGLDLVIVSDSPRECPVCRPFEGKILVLDGAVGRSPGTLTRPNELGGAPVKVKVHGSLESARKAGFQHPNCTHSYSAFIPGATKIATPDSNPDGYEQKQQQRALERKVREWKRAEVLALDAESKRAASRKVKDWQASLRAHVKEHDLKRQSGRESITRAV